MVQILYKANINWSVKAKSIFHVFVGLYSTETQICKNRQKKVLMTTGSLMKSKVLQNDSFGAFCISFDLHLEIIGLENYFLFFLRVALFVFFLFVFLLLYVPSQQLWSLRDGQST